MANMGRPGPVCGPEHGTVASMETGAVVERDRPGTRQTCWIDSWCGVIERRVHSCRSQEVALGVALWPASRLPKCTTCSPP